jgi:predicted Zn-dependent peptidase
MDDLNAAKVDDVAAFFKQYYAPNNATLVVAGDFQPAEIKATIAKYFGDIPSVPKPPEVRCDQKFNTGAIARTVPDKNATIPAVLRFYRVPPVANEDYPALELLGTILGGGESSRLNKVLARETKVAAAVQTLVNPIGPTRGPGIFGALVIANAGVKPDSVATLLDAQFAKLVADGVTEKELTKAKNTWRANTITGRQRALGVAEAVQYADLFLGSADKVNTDVERYSKVTIADLQRVAKTYLRADNSVTLTIVPPTAANVVP